MDVRVSPARKPGLLVMFVFGFVVVLAWNGVVQYFRAGNYSAAAMAAGISLISLFFLFAGYWLVFYCMGISISRKQMGIRSFFRWVSIDLNEVEYFEEGGGNMILGNAEKRLAFPSFKYWSRREREEPIKVLVTALAERDVRLSHSMRAMVPVNRGV